MYKFNYDNSNFYFLINNFFQLNIHFNSFFLNYSSSNLNNYDELRDSKKLFPLAQDFSFQDISFLNEYLYIRNSSFINFFLNNMIDVPICFKKSNSLKTKNFELPLLKFSNFLMKEGKREKITRILFNSFRFFFNFFKFTKLKNSFELIN